MICERESYAEKSLVVYNTSAIALVYTCSERGIKPGHVDEITTGHSSKMSNYKNEHQVTLACASTAMAPT